MSDDASADTLAEADKPAGDLTVSPCTTPGHSGHAATVTIDVGEETTEFCVDADTARVIGRSFAAGEIGALCEELADVRDRAEYYESQRDDYAARLKAVDGSWAKLAVERDRLSEALDFAEKQDDAWTAAVDEILRHSGERSNLTDEGRREAAVSYVRGLEAERDKLIKTLRAYERITTAWTRGMYSARIDCWRGDTKAAIECLSEGLDGYDGTEWNGTETGAEWWERTKAEEGLS